MKTSVTTVKVNGVPGYTTYRLARPDSHLPQPSYSCRTPHRTLHRTVSLVHPVLNIQCHTEQLVRPQVVDSTGCAKCKNVYSMAGVSWELGVRHTLRRDGAVGVMTARAHANRQTR